MKRSAARRFLFLASLTALLTPHGPSAPMPPSSAFLPDGRKWYPLEVPGAHPVLAGDRIIRIVELRGWLRAVDSTCRSRYPAFYYLLEPDPIWTDSVGMSLADIIRVGNITGLTDQYRDPSADRVVGLPLIRIEFGGWDSRRQGPPPSNWRYEGAPGCPDVHFAFDPLRPIPSGPRLVPGRYVRVVGSLVSDAPHAGKAAAGVWLVRNFGIALNPKHRIYATQESWSEGGESNPSNPARWTEIHPPDVIEPLPNPRPSETVRGVAICVRKSLWGEAAGPLTLSLSPPGPRPTWARGIRVREIVLAACPRGAFARALAACRVRADGDVGRIRIDLENAGLDKFAAIYRVSWNPGGNAWTVVRPATLY